MFNQQSILLAVIFRKIMLMTIGRFVNIINLMGKKGFPEN